MISIPNAPSDITPAWLTAVFQKNNIPHTTITNLDTSEVNSWAKHALSITVTYTDDAPAKAPRHLFCKIYEGGDAFNGYGEIHYYTQLAPQLAQQISPRFFAGEFDMEAMQSYFIIADISRTHAPRTTAPPTQQKYEKLVDGLALLHAHWWEDERIEQPDFYRRQGGPLRLAQAIPETDYMKSFEAFTAVFPDHLATAQPDLTPKQHALCQLIVEQWPRLWLKRIGTGKHITMIHGDAHYYNNVWLPNDPSGQVQLLDWETYKRGIGAFDLAYMLYYDVANRRRWERHLLQRYYSNLVAAGISDYSWEQLLDDYRLGLMLTLFPSFWWPVYPSVHAVLAALEEWDCEKLLSS